MDRNLNIWLNNNPFNNKTEAKPHSDAILQQLLQNSLNTSATINIFKNPNGKPYVHEDIFFSHANSRYLHAYVISKDHEVGVDVELINTKKDVMKLASRYYHADEVNYLSEFQLTQQITEFYQLWTRKEAWCKLEGGNLWSYLARPVLPDSPLKTLEGKQFYMKCNDQIKGFACAVAATAPIEKIRINSLGTPCID
ncbi:MAG: 4'-phosphopantetheinyl transferase family protein [Marinicella sp.]